MNLGLLNVQRVSQLDGLYLDEELQSLLFSKALNGFRFCPPGLIDTCRPELELLFRTFYFWQSIAKDVPSPGNVYQNLQYRNEVPFSNGRRISRFGNEIVPMAVWQKALHFALPIVLRYAWTRLRRHATNRGWADLATSLAQADRAQEAGSESARHDLDEGQRWWGTAWRAIERTETILKALETLNFAVFLVSGKYRTLVDRLAQTRLVYQDPSAKRMVTFEFLNRRLVWEGFSEFILFCWPLITHNKFKRAASLLLRRLLLGRARGIQTHSQDGKCAVCRSDTPTMPHVARPCGHVYCFACAVDEMGVTETDEISGHSCIKCLQRITSLVRAGTPDDS